MRSAEFQVVDEAGTTFAEAAPGQPLIRGPRDYSRVIEAGLSGGVRTVLLYASNLPAAFFDLSSGQAGELLQKLQNYGMRVAIVQDADVTMSSRFGEMLAEARRLGILAVVDTREDAQTWMNG